jgi:hypothetical protein
MDVDLKDVDLKDVDPGSPPARQTEMAVDLKAACKAKAARLRASPSH